MATAITASRVVLGAPDIRRHDGEIRLTVPIINAGEVTLNGLKLTGITLGSTAVLSPPGWPMQLSVLGASMSTTVAARFSDQGLADGANLLLTVRGSYTVQGVAYGLTLNRYLRLPPPSARPAYELRATIHSAMANGLWNYVLTNREPLASTQRIATFALDIRAPVTITGTPSGWAVDTDSLSYVLWYATDLMAPYPNHILPGSALSGFQLTGSGGQSEVAGANVVAWDHATDKAGLVFADHVLIPARLG